MKVVKLNEVEVGDRLQDCMAEQLATLLQIIKIENSRVYCKHIGGIESYISDQDGLIVFSIYSSEPFYKLNNQ